MVRDHIVARIHGGNENRDNIQWLCRRCNSSKGTGDACRINHQGETRDRTA